MPDEKYAIIGAAHTVFASRNAYLHIMEDGSTAYGGMSHGALELWHRDRNIVVIKEKGHREYYNQYNPPFKVPTQFHIFHWINAGEVEYLGAFPVTKDAESWVYPSDKVK
jgi:hypothetical protein